MNALQNENTQRPLKKIMVIDDEQNVLRSVRRELRDMAVEIFTYDDPFEAISDMVSLQPDVILSDVRMPGITGIKLMEEASVHLPNSERILLTGWSEPEDVINAINHGHVHYYMSKPWTTERLKQVVGRGFELSHLRAKNDELVEVTGRQNSELQALNGKLESKVIKRTDDLKKSYNDSIVAFTSLIDRRLSERKDGTRRVMRLCLDIAERMALSLSLIHI